VGGEVVQEWWEGEKEKNNGILEQKTKANWGGGEKSWVSITEGRLIAEDFY